MFIAISSCSKEVSTNIATMQPLGVGYYWNFVDSTFSSSGVLTKVDSSRLGITGKSIYSYKGEQLELFWWNWYDKALKAYTSSKWLSKNDETGCLFYGGVTSDSVYIFGKSLNIKYPVSLNESWERRTYTYHTASSKTSFYISDTLSVICKAVDEKFTTSIGQLNCNVYEYRRKDQHIIDLYYSLNIGYVGLIDRLNGVILSKKTILSYNLSEGSVNLKSINQPEFSEIKNNVSYSPFE